MTDNRDDGRLPTQRDLGGEHVCMFDPLTRECFECKKVDPRTCGATESEAGEVDLSELTIPFNLMVDLVYHGDCHAKPDPDLAASFHEVCKTVAEWATQRERERAAKTVKRILPTDMGEHIAAAIRGEK